MSVIAFGSAKAAPGVTTALLACAAAWPADRRVVVAELDPDGGDVAAWYGLRGEPGLLSYAAQGRRSLHPDTILDHTQPLPGPGGVRVLVGPPAPEQAAAGLGALLGAGLDDRLGGLAGVDVLVDCGRLRPGSPLTGLLPAVTTTVLVARPTLAEIAHLRPRVAALRASRPALLLIGEAPYDAEEVAEALAAPVLGVLADDARGAAALAGRAASRHLRRSALARSAVAIAERLTATGADEPKPQLAGEPVAAPVAPPPVNGRVMRW